MTMTPHDAPIREGDIVQRSGHGPRFRVTAIHNDGRSACFMQVKKDGTRDLRYSAGHSGSLAEYVKVENEVRRNCVNR